MSATIGRTTSSSARSLRDTARFLDLLRPATARRESPDRYVHALTDTLPPLRIGTCSDSPAGEALHPGCVRVVEDTGRRLAAAGHAIEHAAPATFFEYEERALHGAALGRRSPGADLEEIRDRPLPSGVRSARFQWSRRAAATCHAAGAIAGKQRASSPKYASS
jgi:Asp-tRNA(Asn)/Glu-tRNA(Gln) amidotransferase A subunit family amidase